MRSAPNIAAFKEAQSWLRNNLGTSADFRIPGARTYPVGTQVDPETGRPYDPTIRALTEPVETRTHMVGVITVANTPRAEVAQITWAGLRRGDKLVIEMDPAAGADVEDATEVLIKGLRFKIMEMHIDPGVDDRWLAHLELT
jgi:hypothetical protein